MGGILGLGDRGSKEARVFLLQLGEHGILDASYSFSRCLLLAAMMNQ